jgi:hypothetical protein
VHCSATGWALVSGNIAVRMQEFARAALCSGKSKYDLPSYYILPGTRSMVYEAFRGYEVNFV